MNSIAAPNADDRGAAAGPHSAPESGHVLLADDEAAFQRLGSAFLRGLGHTVTLAGDGEQALAAFARQRPELVLLDLAMPPHMDPEIGLQLIPRFAPQVPVVVLTGHGDHALALRATELGAWDFLTKPVDPEMLRFVVARGDSALVTLPVRFTYRGLGAAGRQLLLNGTVRYRVHGDFSVNTPLGGFTRPYDRVGAFSANDARTPPRTR